MFNRPFPASVLFVFVFSTVDGKYVGHFKNLPIRGFELWTSVSEATILPTESQPLPNLYLILDNVQSK